MGFNHNIMLKIRDKVIVSFISTSQLNEITFFFFATLLLVHNLSKLINLELALYNENECITM